MTVENTAATAAPIPSADVQAPAAPAISQDSSAAATPAAVLSPDAVSPAPGAPIQADAPKAEADKKPTTLLGAEVEKPAEVKAPAAEADKAEGLEIKKEEASQSVDPAPLPSFEAFTVPEGVTFDQEKLGEFTKELGEFAVLTKADTAAVQAFGQKMMDRHIAEMSRVYEGMQAVWEKQKNDWKESFEKDPEIGGNRANTVLNGALQFIRTHGGTTEQQAEFRNLMESTGIGNHPAMIRILAKANTVLSEGKPLPGTKPMPQTQSKVSRRYGETK